MLETRRGEDTCGMRCSIQWTVEFSTGKCEYVNEVCVILELFEYKLITEEEIFTEEEEKITNRNGWQCWPRKRYKFRTWKTRQKETSKVMHFNVIWRFFLN